MIFRTSVRVRPKKVLTSENKEEKTKSQAISRVGITNINHMLGINPFQAQSLPSQKRILSDNDLIIVKCCYTES